MFQNHQAVKPSKRFKQESVLIRVFLLEDLFDSWGDVGGEAQRKILKTTAGVQAGDHDDLHEGGRVLGDMWILEGFRM